MSEFYLGPNHRPWACEPDELLEAEKYDPTPMAIPDDLIEELITTDPDKAEPPETS